MDFLRLFPSSSSSTLSATNEQSQIAPSQPLLFSAYRNLGLLCYSNSEPNKLHLVIRASAGPPSTAKTLEKSSNSSQPVKTCVLFKRITTVVLSPKLPENAQFTNLLVNASGSRATLVGTRMIFVVELDTDFWHRPPFDGPDCVDHLRPEYYAKCDLLHVGLFVRKFPPAVRCVRWFEPVSDFLEIFGSTKMPTLSRLSSLLAVLFSDNVIRLYDVSSAVDSPLIQFDFNALLPDRTPDDSEASGDEFGRGRAHSTLGFITQLVSFDFGPPQSVDGNRTALGSLLALDSNGQLYATLFPFDGIGPCAPPKGPLPLYGFPASSQHRLLCSALDLLHIRHPFGVQHFSLWAMASEDGLLTHFILPTLSSIDTLPLDGRSGANANVLSPSFELFAIDCVDIGKTICRNASRDSKSTTSMLKAISRLQKMEFCDHCAYLVVGQRDVFRVELTALADHLWHQCTIKSNANTTKAMGEVSSSSNVHQLLMFADSGESPSIGSVVCVQAPIGTDVDNDDDGGTDVNRQQKQRRDLLIAAECSFGTKMGRKSAFLATLASCLPSSPSSFSASQQQQAMMQKGPKVVANFNKKPLLADDVRAFLAQHQAGSAAQHQLPQTLPAVVHFADTATAAGQAVNNNSGGMGEDEELEQLQQRAAQLSFVQQSIDQVLLQGQLPARSVAIDYALKRASELLLSLQAVELFRQSATQRLTAIFRQLNELKAKIRQRQQNVRVAEQRIVRIAQSMHSLVFPTTNAEQAAVAKMGEVQHKLSKCAEETAKIVDRVRVHRQSLCAGGPSSFCCPSSFSSLSISNPPPIAHHNHQQQFHHHHHQQQLSFISAPCALHSSHGPSTTTTANAIPAQLFMLSKNGRECSKLREMVSSLGEQLNVPSTTKIS
ncbi:hypothetical protein niasHT_000974 [Heterodera trifolii]|uniref:Nuclear pore complex protein Nup88 n=1 Tax=Heterodera trifolii TaxID=157864 RepID=A0ABD2M518_9BILA